ncbi:MAG: F0F1 ATP synthase subunit epsilon [Oscillospiraceae bacterium]|nr:F0F1 ATP synthase subunit epsilon [Oscillospiraceae bacterium]
MEKKIRLEIVTLSGTALEAECASVQLPLAQGLAGVLPDHAPLLAVLAPGVVRYRTADGARYAAVSGGTAHVLHDRVTLLCTAAGPADSQEEARRLAAQWES